MIDLDSQEWSRALREGMGARFERFADGGMLACFRAGPFRVAYPDFLIGSGSELSPDALASRVEAARGFGADLVRVQSESVLDDRRVMKVHRLGTVAIPNLEGWSARELEKARRASNRRSRSSLKIRPGRTSDGAALHRLYRATLLRHGGALRYSQRYFELIAPHASLVAELDGQLCGFVCVGFQAHRACYMHGAHDSGARSHYPSDQLFLEMLETAREKGIRRFDFLPSPPAQQSLNAYKKAWGGVDQSLSVSDLALHPVRTHAFTLATKLMNSLASLRKA
ncbi:GNAT family N-acetyltransferase [Marilutibacter aestuarii]|nr:GNAT family N-acetyltransferase [Lysobacter aestuarii]